MTIGDTSLRDSVSVFDLTTSRITFITINRVQGFAMKDLKTAQIITRVTEDDREWVKREAEKLGLDPSSFVRMTLRNARNARDTTEPMVA